jgi:phosphatidylglycerophosphatase A
MAININKSGISGFCGCAYFESYKIRPIRKFKKKSKNRYNPLSIR